MLQRGWLVLSLGCFAGLAACDGDDSDDSATPEAGSGSSGTGGKSSGGNAGKTAAGASGAGKGASGSSAGTGGKGTTTAGNSAGGSGGAGGSGALGKRAQDDRTFTIDEATVGFDALPAPTVDTDRYSGVLDGAGYRIEVPKNWNGVLVMYAHGYVGPGPALRITTPSIRRYLVEQGYAWAASSYTKNYYDVRVGVEDTNKLALAFKRLVGEKGRTVDEPSKRYIIGHSMGGHITAAAIEDEAEATASNKVEYAAAMPMCGVTGDTTLFNYFAAYQFAAQKLAGTPVAMNATDFMAVRMQTQDALFSVYPTQTTELGAKIKTIVENLTGGARPGFEPGFSSKQWQDAVWGTFGGDGTVNGILDRSVIDTRDVVYQLDNDAAQSDDEKKFNAEVVRSTPASGANDLRTDGLRWVPKVNGEFNIPVLTLHTLGDLYVPFMQEQVYREHATTKGNSDRLVQRAIRGVGHCEFTYVEQVDAFAALVKWEKEGTKPEGDDVLDKGKIAASDYGCKFTKNEYNADEQAAGALGTSRALIPACP
ncbi:MAG: hypothetical protein RL701_7113 [Pseudomonadota bacterium]